MNDKILFICLEKNNLVHACKLINLYKNEHPDINVFILSDLKNSKFLDIQNVKKIEINIDDLLKDISLCGLDLYKRSIVLNSYLEKIIKQIFDLIINLDYLSPISAVISSYLSSKNVWGASYDEYGFPWFDNNKFKYLVYSKQNNNLFFYTELIYKALNKDPDIYKNASFSKFENIVCVSQKDIHLSGFNVIKSSDYDVLKAKVDNFDICITDDDFIANINAINGVDTVFVSRAYLDFYNVYPYQNKVKYIIASKIDETLLNNITNNNYLYKPIFDKFGYSYIVPENKIDITKEIYDFFILKSVWKSVLNREVPVGDSKRFVSIGEKYIDRVMDINVEIDFLNLFVFTCFNFESVKNEIEKSNDVFENLDKIKKLAFEGELIAKSYLHSVSSSICDIEKIKSENKKLINLDNKIYDSSTSFYILNDFVNYFKNERNNYHLRNLFPMVKNIVFTYENLYSKLCFYEEILKGILHART